MTDNATIKGLEEIVRKINKLQPPRSNAIKQRAMDKSVKLVRQRVAIYPSASIANSPANGYSWYQRGFGTRTRTGLAYPTSETLGRRWTDTVEDSGNRGIVGNNASYAQLVQDQDMQTTFHLERGWVTTQEVIEESGQEIVDFFAEEYSEVLSE